jgi:hypothetical protein
MIPFWDKNEAGYVGNDYPDNDWDKCKLAGVQVPGATEVIVSPKQKIEALKVHGVDGGPTIERGHEATKLVIEVKIWTPSQWRLWQELLAIIWRQPGKASRLDDALARDQKKNGVAIEHVKTAVYKITAIGIESPGCPILGPDKICVQKIQAIQFIPQTTKSATKKLNGAKTPLTPEFQKAKNAAGPKPSLTDNVPELSSPAAPFSPVTR